MARIAITCFCLTIFLVSLEASPLKMGFVVDPKENDVAAVQNRALAFANTNLVAIHLDQCVPWVELLGNKSLPEWLITNLKELKAAIPNSHSISLAVTPTAMDRQSFAPACGPNHYLESMPLPGPIRGAKLDDPIVRAAFLKYVFALIDILEPDFLNIGIEISELAVHSPSRWPEYDAFFSWNYGEIKARYNHVQVGMEMVLQSLMEDQLSSLLMPTFLKGDFLGFSFYPYGSPLAEAFTKQTALPAPPEQWRKGFRFMSNLRKTHGKPLALCETGYLSHNSSAFGVSLNGSELLQSAFTNDLLKFAAEEELAFVIWFVPVDFHQALLSLPKAYKEVMEAGKIWSYSGMWNEDRTPKPALSQWQQGLHRAGND